ncbi:hypothetical protein [Dongshaea marina]|nr:hypothetical protein [Dongshaea marina]
MPGLKGKEIAFVLFGLWALGITALVNVATAGPDSGVAQPVVLSSFSGN